MQNLIITVEGDTTFILITNYMNAECQMHIFLNKVYDTNKLCKGITLINIILLCF